MKPVLIRCPVTSMLVQHLVDDEAKPNSFVFKPLKCPACGRLHLINGAGELSSEGPKG
jgi:hypothetical protein